MDRLYKYKYFVNLKMHSIYIFNADVVNVQGGQNNFSLNSKQNRRRSHHS